MPNSSAQPLCGLQPVLTCHEARQWEERILPDEETAWEAMQAAGIGLADEILGLYSEFADPSGLESILILAGSGHNAGDAFLAAETLLECLEEVFVTVVLAGEESALKPLAARALHELREEAADRLDVIPFSPEIKLDGTWDLLIDGLLGMSFQPPLREPMRELFTWAEGLRASVRLWVAVDLPSGLGDDSAQESGEGEGDPVLAADATIATGIVKQPLLEESAWQVRGRVRSIDLGFFNEARPEASSEPSPQWLTPEVLEPLRRPRLAASDKRTYGHLFLVGGSRSMPGAILMSTMAAARSGVGLLTAFVPAQVASRIPLVVPEAMTVPLPTSNDGGFTPETANILRGNMTRATALILGPGMDLDTSTRFLMGRLARDIPLPLVLDATALQPDVMNALAGRQQGAGPVILTPHMGEYMRILRRDKGGLDLSELMAYCRKFRVTIILKGPITWICNGETLVASSLGGPVLARGGSGDLLAGICGSLLAREGVSANPLDIACQAVAWHGMAADAWARERGTEGVRTSELLNYLSPVLREGL